MKRTFFSFTLVLLLGCLMATNAWAAKKVEFLSANAAGYIQKMNSLGDRIDRGDQGHEAMGSILGLTKDEKFSLLRQMTDFNGVTHTRYCQMYHGIPIWGLQTIVSRNSSDQVVRLLGSVALDIPKDILGIPGTLDAQCALKRLEDRHKAQAPNAIWSIGNEESGTYIYIDKNSKANLCYVVSFFAENDAGNPSRPIFFIDAGSGKILESYDRLAYGDGTGPGGNLKIGQYEYGTDYPGFGVTINGSIYTMDTADVKTVDLNHGYSGSTAYSYIGPRNTHESVNGGFCPLNDAQYFGQVVFDTYRNWYGVPPLPFKITIRCHYGTNVYASWDGSNLTFGDGDENNFYPMVCLDAVAHEVSHGFTENHSGLIYIGQSGGINESFSDMAGEACKYNMRGVNNFMCNSDIYKVPGLASRYMYDPPLDGMSIDHVGEYYEGLDVHYSSGIFNKAFYLIATSPGWTTRMAFDVFVKANMNYWVPSSTFQQAATGALYAAQDYAYPCQDVANAFAAVGITLSCGGSGGGDMYVGNIAQTITKAGRKYKSTAVVTMRDTNSAPVSNATVYITWSGVAGGSASGVTDSSGNVTFTSDQVNQSGPFTITVTNATHASLTYNPALNIETSDTASY